MSVYQSVSYWMSLSVAVVMMVLVLVAAGRMLLLFFFSSYSSVPPPNLNVQMMWFGGRTGTRSFTVAAQTLWNSLPSSVKSAGNIVTYRCQLKPNLFKLAYPPLLLNVPI